MHHTGPGRAVFGQGVGQNLQNIVDLLVAGHHLQHAIAAAVELLHPLPFSHLGFQGGGAQSHPLLQRPALGGELRLDAEARQLLLAQVPVEPQGPTQSHHHQQADKTLAQIVP